MEDEKEVSENKPSYRGTPSDLASGKKPTVKEAPLPTKKTTSAKVKKPLSSFSSPKKGAAVKRSPAKKGDGIGHKHAVKKNAKMDKKGSGTSSSQNISSSRGSNGDSPLPARFQDKGSLE